MSTAVSANTQAILLLTAPLLIGAKAVPATDLLTNSEYKKLARRLREMKRQPADLLASDADEVIDVCGELVDSERLRRLLARGFLLSQALERWQARSIWVLSRADIDYPKRLKIRLKEDAPPVLYGCGEMSLLNRGGLAVVGSRDVGEKLVEYTQQVGKLAASADVTIVSGGARGVDQAAMVGALEAGGAVCDVMAENLEKAALGSSYRRYLMERTMVLVSAYDPSAGFNVGHAMQRNKLIYALSDAALVVNSNVNKGGTWAGAVEQLDKLKFVPVFVRSDGEANEGLSALQRKGAAPWPNPRSAESLLDLLSALPKRVTTVEPAELGGDLLDVYATRNRVIIAPSTDLLSAEASDSSTTDASSLNGPGAPAELQVVQRASEKPVTDNSSTTPADHLWATVRALLEGLLISPMNETDISAALGVSAAQTKEWLKRLTDEGILKRTSRPVMYVLNNSRLL
ncbi:DNA-processing protein DprA [Paraburkholderia hospita]|uniref:DNA-processing protein DprA n=1 Tax=Paraburkholderia hospita TaxID=169430 RepID=UPI000B34927D|nr:DNA-processing protein DprA [Paraburkholderia hospita]OUL72148.1 DNA protecting protein DprA [Paraburkholderia hospita]